MRVDIQILSGARQGEHVVLDVDRFRVGDQRDCEVRFDPARDAAARGHAATIQRDDDGWRIRNTGTGDVLVNHEPVFGNTRLRSGDVVRMSENGPDFSFTIGASETDAASPQPNTARFRPLPSPLELNELTTGADLRRSPRTVKLPRGLLLGISAAVVLALLLGLLLALHN
ncbi:MAG: hypothetical protein JW818_13900 [Pirellulales bacterium]|nr:hypothetical protein [Pirellulales bacterium]